jgi:farnesyl-diphosphate farnesyltransferase
MNSVHPGLLTDLLRQVSRSFYTTLRILPAAVRPQIGLAYLLARTTDTIADTEIIPLGQRHRALQLFRDRILGAQQSSVDLAGFAEHQASQAEGLLMERAEDAISLLDKLSELDQKLVREVLEIITSGQELDLTRFAVASNPSSTAR